MRKIKSLLTMQLTYDVLGFICCVAAFFFNIQTLIDQWVYLGVCGISDAACLLLNGNFDSWLARSRFEIQFSIAWRILVLLIVFGLFYVHWQHGIENSAKAGVFSIIFSFCVRFARNIAMTVRLNRVVNRTLVAIALFAMPLLANAQRTSIVTVDTQATRELNEANANTGWHGEIISVEVTEITPVKAARAQRPPLSFWHRIQIWLAISTAGILLGIATLTAIANYFPTTVIGRWGKDWLV